MPSIRVTPFRIVVLTLFIAISATVVLFTQNTHLKRVAEKQAALEKEILATAEELERISEEPKLPFSLEQNVFVPHGETHGLLELSLNYRNDSDREHVLLYPFAQLLTAEGEHVPEFFVAFAEEPRVAPSSTQEISLRYWLRPTERNRPLFLEINGFRLPLDSTASEDA